MTLTTYYTNPSNLAVIDVSAITAATKTIDFAAYSLTEPEVIQAVLARAKAGVQVRLYLDRTELEAEARGDATLSHSALGQLTNQPNIAIKVKKSAILMHLKSYCTDGSTLRDGSANFSPLGEFEQDNSVTFTTDTQALANFTAKFASMWAREDNLTIAEAIATSNTSASRPHQR